MRKPLIVVAGFALMCGPAVAQSRPADFISVAVTRILPADLENFARILFEVTNRSPLTYTGVALTCSAFDAEEKLMGVGSAAVRNVGSEVTPSTGMINVQPHHGYDVTSASCRVELIIP